MGAVCEESFGHAFSGVDRTWFSLCFDVLDIGAVPNWGDEPLGLSSHDVVDAVVAAGKRGLDVLSIQFVAPDSPCAQRLAVYVCVYLMGAWVLRAQGRA